LALEVALAALIAFLKILMPTLLLVGLGTASLWVRRMSWRDLGLKRPASWRNTLGAATLLAVAAFAFNLWIARPAIEALTGQVRDFSQFKSVQGNVRTLLGWLAISWVLGGFLEEMAFRGYVLNRSLDLFGLRLPGIVAAVLLNASAFGALHASQGLDGMLNTAVDGAIFSLVYLIGRRNLWLTVLMHGIGNTLGLIAMYQGWFGLLG
jgi:membrane protease YdiL (CAAX protease family)